MVKRRLSKKGGALDPRIWTIKQAQDYLLAQNNGKQTWKYRDEKPGSVEVYFGKKRAKWLLKDPELGIPMMKEVVENKLNKQGWEVEPDGLFGSNNVGFQLTQSVFPDMLNMLWGNNNSNSLENVPFRSFSSNRSPSNSNGNVYKSRNKKYSKKRSKKKTPMVIRNGNVVMCKSNSN